MLIYNDLYINKSLNIAQSVLRKKKFTCNVIDEK